MRCIQKISCERLAIRKERILIFKNIFISSTHLKLFLCTVSIIVQHFHSGAKPCNTFIFNLWFEYSSFFNFYSQLVKCVCRLDYCFSSVKPMFRPLWHTLKKSFLPFKIMSQKPTLSPIVSYWNPVCK